jgi:transcriptional regulator with AAA-type ATPase domain
METLKLYRGDQLLTAVALGERPLELGRASSCDLVIDDPELAARHWLAVRRAGTLIAYDVSAGRRGQSRHWPLGSRVAVGRHHSVIREFVPSAEHVRVAARDERDRDTESLGLQRRSSLGLSIVVGQGREARRLRIGEHPLHVGRDADNHLVLADRAVSPFHCRFEPSGEGLVLRDLGSVNGTYVNGVRIVRVVVDAGASIRLGRSDLRLVQRDLEGRVAGSAFVAASSGMIALVAEAQRVAPLPWPALILGESGSGKEGIATLLHTHGQRRGPLVTLNAGGVPHGLIESELFGHEKGAFTGASAGRRGAFEQAEGGTLFLDEIGELPLTLQARLLRVLESGEVRRVGGEGARQVDVRVVCATHRDLRALVGAGKFRQDLYFRIARVVLELPPLRARRDDIAPLCEHFLRSLDPVIGRRELEASALERLSGYDWPGNVRELRNVLCAAAVEAGCPRIELAHVQRALSRLGGQIGPSVALPPDRMREAIEAHHGNVAAAARSLGMPRSTLRDRMRQLELEAVADQREEAAE